MTEAWRSRIVGESDEDPNDLKAHDLNWRAHPAMQRAGMAGALAEVGWVTRVIVNKTTGNIVDGHLRVDLARAKGERVPVTWVELSEDEEKLVLATLDPLGALATTDPEALAELLSQVSTSDDALRDLLSTLGATPEDVKGSGLIEAGEYGGEAIGYAVEVIVKEPVDRDKASEAMTKLGYAPKVRTIRNFDET